MRFFAWRLRRLDKPRLPSRAPGGTTSVFAWLLWAGGLLACALAGGCDDSAVPLSEPEQARADQGLVGIWRHKNSDETGYFHLGLLGGEAPKGLLRVLTVGWSNDGELHDPGQALAFSTTLSGASYLNVVNVEAEQLKKVRETGWQPDLFDAYFILKYRVEGDVLLLWPMDREAKRRAIEAGSIKGEIKEGLVPRVRFTDASENLRQLLAAEGDKLFANEPLRMQRVR